MIGVSSTNFSEYPLEEVIPQMDKLFDHWEIFSEAEHYLPAIAPRLAMIKDSYDLSYSIHAPICDVNIASLNERMREASVLELMTIMEHAINLDIDTITIHPGLYSMAVPGMEERSIANAKKSLRTLDRVISEYGVKMALENMPSFPFMLGQTPEEMKELFDGTNIRICFDIGHANTVGCIDEMIDCVKDRLVNVHIHDNDGSMDQHRTIGEAGIDFHKYVAKLETFYRGNYIIESKSLESAVDSLDYLDKLFSTL